MAYEKSPLVSTLEHRWRLWRYKQHSSGTSTSVYKFTRRHTTAVRNIQS